MKKKITLLFLSMLLVVIFSGCTTRLGDFTVISTKSIDWGNVDKFKRGTDQVTGEDKLHIIIFVPTKFAINMEEAVDNAIESVPGAIAITDAVVYYRYWWIPYIYGQMGYVVEGTPLIDTSLLAASEDSGEGYFVSYVDKQGNQVTKAVTEKEYHEIKSKTKK